jgi:hypothetical protein
MVIAGVPPHRCEQEDPVNDRWHVPEYSFGEFRHASTAIEVS